MSKTGLLLQCGWAFNNPLIPPTIANDPMRYGSAFHELLALSLENGVPPELSLAVLPAIAKKFHVREDELRAHASDAYKTLLDWLNGDNAFGLKLLPAPKGAIVIEKAIAYNTAAYSARMAPPVDENHVYQDVTPEEQPGTVDVAIRLGLYGTRVPPRFRKAVIVLDHKTGMSFDNPRDSKQLRSLALAFARLWKAERAIVAINHAPRDGLPAVFADELTKEELDEHADNLRDAFVRIGDGSLRPGPECGYCAGNAVCPAYGGSLASLSRDLQRMEGALPPEPLEVESRKALNKPTSRLDIETPEGIGTVHMILQMIRRLDDEWSERIKQKIRDGMVGVRPDGKISVLKIVERDNLSLASIKRAFKKPGEAAKIEKMLRDAGAIEKLEREELRAVDDR